MNQFGAQNMVSQIKKVLLEKPHKNMSKVDYKKWYGKNLTSNKVLKNSIYSITEFKKDTLKKYNIISCPGCYPTSILLPLIPLIKYNLVGIKV